MKVQIILCVFFGSFIFFNECLVNAFERRLNSPSAAATSANSGSLLGGGTGASLSGPLGSLLGGGSGTGSSSGTGSGAGSSSGTGSSSGWGGSSGSGFLGSLSSLLCPLLRGLAVGSLSGLIQGLSNLLQLRCFPTNTAANTRIVVPTPSY